MSGFKAASTTIEPEHNTEHAAMVHSMMTNRKLLLCSFHRLSNVDVKRSKMPHLAKTALITKLPSTRKEVWLKKLPKRIVEVVIIVRASPKTAETLPITGMNSATQKSGITSNKLNVSTPTMIRAQRACGSKPKVLIHKGSNTATKRSGGPLSVKN